jgi:hypothetical protein
MSTLFRYDPTPASDVRGSSNDTSGAYHDSIMGSKNVAYSRERTRFRFETAFDNGGVFVVDDDEDVAAVAVVVVGWVEEEEEEEEEAEDVDARAVGGGEDGALLPLPAPPPRRNALASPPHSDASNRRNSAQATTKGRWVDSVFLEGFILYTSGFFTSPPLSLSLSFSLFLSLLPRRVVVVRICLEKI